MELIIRNNSGQPIYDQISVHPSCVCLCHLNISYIIPLHFLKTFRDIWNKLILHWTYYKESSVIEK